MISCSFPINKVGGGESKVISRCPILGVVSVLHPPMLSRVNCNLQKHLLIYRRKSVAFQRHYANFSFILCLKVRSVAPEVSLGIRHIKGYSNKQNTSMFFLLNNSSDNHNKNSGPQAERVGPYHKTWAITYSFTFKDYTSNTIAMIHNNALYFIV